jgi:basic amino acid/polyamine antiporter, APA family
MEETHHLKRALGLFDATMIVAGSMIGSGIFIVSADMARTVGSTGYLLLLWILTGVITVIAALSYGELAGMMPKAGGQYVYLHKAYNSLIGFLYGWTVFMVIQTGVIAAVAVAFAKFTAVFIPYFSTGNIVLDLGFLKVSSAQLLAIGSIVFLTFLNSRGIKNGKIIQTVFTSTKLVALLALIIIGIIVGLKTNVLSMNFSELWSASKTETIDNVITTIPLSGITLITALGVAMVGSLFSSDAWNNVTFIAGEIRSPQKNIPLSLFFGTLIVTVIYLLANVAYVSLLPLKGNPSATDALGRGIQFATDDRVGTAAASMMLGDTAAYVMAGLIMISTFGCNNGLILSGARVYYAMAKDGLFFKRATTLNKKDVPAFALTLQCIWASVLCLSGTYGDLLDYATFASLIFYIITIAGIFILRKKEPNTERPYKVFGYPILPAIYILVAAAICIDLLIFKTRNTGLGLLIVILGIPIYYFQKSISRVKV